MRVTCGKVKAPVPRLTNVLVELDAPIDLTDAQQKGVHEAVAHCLVHNTLLNAPTITSKVESPAHTTT